MKERLSELVDDGHLQVVRGGWCPRPSTRPCSEAAQDLGGYKAASAGTQAASVDLSVTHTPQGCCPHLAHTTVLTASAGAYFN